MSYQPQLFETEDQYGNDIIQGPKLVKQKLTKAQAIIDPKNPLPEVEKKLELDVTLHGNENSQWK